MHLQGTGFLSHGSRFYYNGIDNPGPQTDTKQRQDEGKNTGKSPEPRSGSASPPHLTSPGFLKSMNLVFLAQGLN